MVRTRTSVSLWGLLVAALLVVVPAGTARAEVTQGIAGTVTGAGGTTIAWAGLWVVPVDPTAQLKGGMTISPCTVTCRVYEAENDGTFAINLPVGDYWLYTVPFPSASTDWTSEWWQDSAVREGSSTVTVSTGAVTTINPELDHGGSIAGTIDSVATDEDGWVEAWLPDSTYPGGYQKVAVAVADAAGNYALTALPTGSYRLYFVTRESKTEGWWHDQTSAGAATAVPVTAPAAVTGVDPTLTAWGTATGTVTRASNGAPVAGAWISFFRVDPLWDGNRQPSYGWTSTTSDGSFSVKLRAGTYRVLFSVTGLKPEFLDGATTWQAGQDVVVTTGDATTGVDVALDPTEVTTLAPPDVTGVARVGATLTAHPGAWYPASPDLDYQWLRDGTAISRATLSTYRVQPKDLGHRIYLRLTARATGFDATTTYTDASDRVLPGVLHFSTRATIQGTYRVGRTLRAVAPVTSPRATRSYRWLRNGHPIARATAATYHLHRADRGARISVRIVLRRAGYLTRTTTPRSPGRVR